MGERLSDEEMDEFLGWLGLRGGGSINLVTFKKLPCWQPEEDSPEGDTPKKKGMLSHFSKVPRPVLRTSSAPPPHPPRPPRPPHHCNIQCTLHLHCANP